MSEETEVAAKARLYRGNSRHDAFELGADELAARFKESSWYSDWTGSEKQLKRDLSDAIRLFIIDDKDGLNSTHGERESSAAIRQAIDLVWKEHKGE